MTTCSSQHDHQPCIVKKHTAIVCPTVNNRLNIHNRCSTRGSLLASLTPTVSFSTSVDGHSTGCSAYCPPIYFGIGITPAQRRREITRHPTTAPHPPRGFWKKLLPLLQWNVYVSQWLSTMTWPGQTGLTNEFTSLPWPRYRGRSVRNVKISLEWRGYWVLVLRLEICYYIKKTLIHGTCVGVLQTPEI